MIVVCKKCYTPFLVPDTLLKEKGKTVKCGKCGNTWIEMPIHKAAPHPTITKKAFIAPPKEIIKRVSVLKKLVHKQAKEAFTVKNLIKDMKVALRVCGVLFLLSIIGVLTGHQFVVAAWPEAQNIYISIGWVDEKREELVLLSVTSERRYLDGAMHLIVKGTIHCVAEKTQVLPDITAEAIGYDGRLIKSWRIKPPKATLKPEGALPFQSIIISPEGTVTEVNLSFSEESHDKED